MQKKVLDVIKNFHQQNRFDHSAGPSLHPWLRPGGASDPSPAFQHGDPRWIPQGMGEVTNGGWMKFRVRLGNLTRKEIHADVVDWFMMLMLMMLLTLTFMLLKIVLVMINLETRQNHTFPNFPTQVMCGVNLLWRSHGQQAPNLHKETSTVFMQLGRKARTHNMDMKDVNLKTLRLQFPMFHWIYGLESHAEAYSFHKDKSCNTSKPLNINPHEMMLEIHQFIYFHFFDTCGKCVFFSNLPGCHFLKFPTWLVQALTSWEPRPNPTDRPGDLLGGWCHFWK